MSEANPVAQLGQYLTGSLLANAISVLASAHIPDLLGETAESVSTLAEKAEVSADALRRLLRLLAGFGIFREEAKGYFTHTEASRVLRADHPRSMRGLFRMLPLESKLLEFLPDTLRTGRSAISFIAPGGPFEYLATRPEEARLFDEGMTSKALGDIEWLLEQYDFTRFSVIADVGGGRGHLIRAILSSAPNATGILFDLPQVVSGAQPSARLTLSAGDFFKDSLPVCDAYLLMNVIHDWADAEAADILAAVRQSARLNSKLLLIESPSPEKSEPGPFGAHLSVVMDARMLIWTGGRERSLSEYEQLLGQAGFSVSRVISSDGHPALIECNPRPVPTREG